MSSPAAAAAAPWSRLASFVRSWSATSAIFGWGGAEPAHSAGNAIPEPPAFSAQCSNGVSATAPPPPPPLLAQASNGASVPPPQPPQSLMLEEMLAAAAAAKARGGDAPVPQVCAAEQPPQKKNAQSFQPSLVFALPPGEGGFPGKLVVREGDITRYRGEAIVNAANSRMLGGGGVDGAIHRMAGPGLRDECAEAPEVTRGVRCPPGEARITGGHRLPAKFVIHTVGPVYSSAAESAPILADAYRNSLELAGKNGIKSVAFPAISCGVYRYPPADAAAVAMDVVARHRGGVETVEFYLFGREMTGVFAGAARAAFGQEEPQE